MTMCFMWGLGKAGLPLAMVIADSGQRVIGVDKDKIRVEMLNKGINPYREEKGVTKLLKKHINKNFYAITPEDYQKMHRNL